MKAMLNGMLSRDPDAPLDLAQVLPVPRPLSADDARLISVAVDNNPELARLSREVAGRKDAIELARMAYIPDINPMGAFTGGASQMVGAMVVLPD
jgi:cobalt-zinc-cadmium efflux system outer membrane protein